jgi:hypothetical protein
MSNPTTPFGWQMPTATDLVTDLPADFEVFGQAVATSMADLLGGTTGQVLAKASGTDMDFQWVAQDDSNAIQNALLTTTGDTIYASAASTPARLGIGTTGQVLTVAGGVPSWATSSSGGMTLLNTGGTTLTGASVTISSIPSTYVNLMVVARNFRPTDDNRALVMRFNGDSNVNRHLPSQTGTALSSVNFDNTYIFLQRAADNGASNSFSGSTIWDYANTATWKGCQTLSINPRFNNPTVEHNAQLQFGFYNQTGAITSLEFLTDGGDFTSGTIFVYGVK